MNEWMDIESAPRTGERFCALIEAKAFDRVRYRPVLCWWQSGLREPKFIFDGWSNCQQPKLWMPLPDSSGHQRDKG